MPTAAPVWRSAVARFTATVDLPTPPLPDETAIVCLTSGMSSSALDGPWPWAWPCACAACGGRAAWPEPIFTWTFDTPGTRPTAREAMLCMVALDAGDWVVKASVKLTCDSAMARSRMSPSDTMSCCTSGSFTARSASSTAS